MSKKNKAALIVATDNKIKSNGTPSLTKGVDVRKLLYDFLDSLPNLVDGGLLFDASIGYSGSPQFIVSNKNAFVPFGQVYQMMSAPRVYDATSIPNYAHDYDNFDCVNITALSTNLQFDAPTGIAPPNDFQGFVIRIHNNNTVVFNLTWDTAFEGTFVALPATLQNNKTMTIAFWWDRIKDKWTCINVLTEL